MAGLNVVAALDPVKLVNPPRMYAVMVFFIMLQRSFSIPVACMKLWKLFVDETTSWGLRVGVEEPPIKALIRYWSNEAVILEPDEGAAATGALAIGSGGDLGAEGRSSS